MFFDDRRDVTTPGISEWEDFYCNYAQGKKAINFLMDSMFYSWHLFRLGHGRAHTGAVPACKHVGKTAICVSYTPQITHLGSFEHSSAAHI